MKVQILKNCISTIDGFKIQEFQKDTIYDLREFVACNLINQKKARYVGDEFSQIITNK